MTESGGGGGGGGGGKQWKEVMKGGEKVSLVAASTASDLGPAVASFALPSLGDDPDALQWTEHVNRHAP